MELNVDLGLEGGVVVQRSSTKEPCSEKVVVEVGLERDERLDEVVGIPDELGVNNLDTSDRGGGEIAFLGSGHCGAGHGQGRNDSSSELHFEQLELRDRTRNC